jgi:hypothetical protein
MHQAHVKIGRNLIKKIVYHIFEDDLSVEEFALVLKKGAKDKLLIPFAQGSTICRAA